MTESSGASNARDDERRDHFDLLRALGALLVLVSHSFALTGRAEPTVLGAVTFGGLGVAIFFAISGYLVAGSWERDPRLLPFLARRALRVFPGLAVAVALCAFVLGPAVTTLPLADYFTRPGTWRYLQTIRLYVQYTLPGVFEGLPHGNAVNGSLWTLPVEFLMYLGVAAIGLVAASRWKVAAVGAFAALVLCGLVWQPAMRSPLVLASIDVRYIVLLGAYFFAGAAIHALRLERRLSPGVLAALALALIVASSDFRTVTPMLWVAVPAFVIALGRAKSRLGAWISQRGDFSYGLYIYAFPVQQTLVWLWPDAPVAPYLFVAFAITLLLAVASWRLVEKPALAHKPQAPIRRATPAALEAPAAGAPSR